MGTLKRNMDSCEKNYQEKRHLDFTENSTVFRKSGSSKELSSIVLWKSQQLELKRKVDRIVVTVQNRLRTSVMEILFSSKQPQRPVNNQ